jgi:hypothetical protein
MLVEESKRKLHPITFQHSLRYLLIRRDKKSISQQISDLQSFQFGERKRKFSSSAIQAQKEYVRFTSFRFSMMLQVGEERENIDISLDVR